MVVATVAGCVAVEPCDVALLLLDHSLDQLDRSEVLLVGEKHFVGREPRHDSEHTANRTPVRGLRCPGKPETARRWDFDHCARHAGTLGNELNAEGGSSLDHPNTSPTRQDPGLDVARRSKTEAEVRDYGAGKHPTAGLLIRCSAEE